MRVGKVGQGVEWNLGTSSANCARPKIFTLLDGFPGCMLNIIRTCALISAGGAAFVVHNGGRSRSVLFRRETLRQLLYTGFVLLAGPEWDFRFLFLTAMASQDITTVSNSENQQSLD
ncbi:unnamed protein product [Phytophthora lilii]|uniref:Unnamed protein product n=1 Tax=Phytophthora lilii TaxID=2077276 RepID=A0A9W6UAR2_9STRA|nr:unnamed protein product [Phytophthora lilii]